MYGKEILGVEKDGKSSDCKLKAILGKESKTTKVVSDLNPMWKELIYIDVNYTSRSVKI